MNRLAAGSGSPIKTTGPTPMPLRCAFPQSMKPWIVASCLFALSAADQAPLDVRLALVIGNSAYANSPLPNPVNDAKAMGETLRGLGFGAIELQDASKAQMA